MLWSMVTWSAKRSGASGVTLGNGAATVRADSCSVGATGLAVPVDSESLGATPTVRADSSSAGEVCDDAGAMASSRAGSSAFGRHAYVRNVLENVFGTVCPFDGSDVVDVPRGERPRQDFMALAGNPTRHSATVRFGLARAGRVQVRAYDVAGQIGRASCRERVCQYV